MPISAIVGVKIEPRLDRWTNSTWGGLYDDRKWARMRENDGDEKNGENEQNPRRCYFKDLNLSVAVADSDEN